jgi:hypothetical protein
MGIFVGCLFIQWTFSQRERERMRERERERDKVYRAISCSLIFHQYYYSIKKVLLDKDD